ncbi:MULTISPECIES: IclR family transcriptional regulator domain-containing protein [Bradyrhizobium]|nr:MULTISPECIES: IclR family transcriptional regulator C-terminal domain-containing protein [Bradyrhizobium]MDN4984451.1 IclR family transcriptional regulator C-terminal domain-containing protein [Bradyrhizobium sp. WYCCWR 13022]MDN5002443.1 IclR family transcriptional regulator C-terminal domain-containing protein [Bradyrhizobium sp. WYCCWR 12677]MDT4736873.1 IclR family transcriptional regulator C-terminal domain-containing protein [Bradyrhizobium sp. WYCCWR 12699]GGI27708.1 transcriptional r
MTKLRAEDTERRQAAGRGPDFLEVLSRSLSVIETLGNHREPPTISDLARATDLPKPSVRRILHTLTTLGYAETSGRTFRLTPKVVRFATSYLASGGHAQVLQPACEELSRITGQSCLVGVLDGAEVLVVAYTMPEQLMSRSLGVGTRFPAYCTAAGRVLLGQKTENELTSYLAKLKPVAQTEATQTDKAVIKSEIMAARKRGYSVMEDEFVMGWRTVAFPLYRHDGSIFGTLNLNCKKSPTLTNDEFDRFVGLCGRKAESLKSLLI